LAELRLGRWPWSRATTHSICAAVQLTSPVTPARPQAEESRTFLDLVNQALDGFRPDVVLRYGGHPARLELMAAARRRRIAVVFHLHNFSYGPRIAEVLGRRRPEIPFLIVESRAAAGGLGGLGLDLSGLENLHRMANTPDPRAFYRVSRIVLVPSLIENAALVAREALANEIPVLASDRGGLPETLGDGGFVFTLSERLLAPGSPVLPTVQEVAPWVAAIEKLWDDPEFEARHRTLALAEARRWEPERLAERYDRFFGSLPQPHRRQSQNAP
jgi:hypothetical protein